jgi:transcriptional regulator with XRE-family HTH domain
MIALHAKECQVLLAPDALHVAQPAATLTGVIRREAVGKALRDIREAKGLKLEDVAIPAGSDAGNLSRIERGLQGYSDETIGRLADALGTPLSQIYALAEQIGRGAVTPNTVGLVQAIESLPPDSRGAVQKVVDSFAKSAPWDGEVERRRGGKEGKG